MSSPELLSRLDKLADALTAHTAKMEELIETMAVCHVELLESMGAGEEEPQGSLDGDDEEGGDSL